MAALTLTYAFLVVLAVQNASGYFWGMYPNVPGGRRMVWHPVDTMLNLMPQKIQGLWYSIIWRSYPQVPHEEVLLDFAMNITLGETGALAVTTKGKPNEKGASCIDVNAFSKLEPTRVRGKYTIVQSYGTNTFKFADTDYAHYMVSSYCFNETASGHCEMEGVNIWGRTAELTPQYLYRGMRIIDKMLCKSLSGFHFIRHTTGCHGQEN
ncbi:uncharacterized protein LOC106163516 [Lingula anatina]|uniref:Uncharacterized protein LOC106163516 n=1 Tax=Lingula anatina TaxID=7574 RepID=A0A1S3IEC2_LINAN|nr:uncharacterized protein LOC106163516 [Lingula anatina]|eukprot:XP_013396577.1 uncharacterized protein LOC106163516 [Lingula anatina]